jgi:hypothetical protein
VFDGSPEEVKEKPFMLRNQLHSFHSQMPIKEKKNINKSRDMKNKCCFVVSEAITDIIIKKI